MAINFKELCKEIPFKWKTQTTKGTKARLVAYIDARIAQDILDDVCGPENWQNEYRVIDGKMYCGVAINVNSVEEPRWIWKWDCGTESNQEAEKGEASDAFKRACVQWGVGRFLYSKKMETLPLKAYNGKNYPATDDGNILWTSDAITTYINNKRNGSNQKQNHQSSYSKPTSEPTYNKVQYSEATIKKVNSLEKNGKKGKECLKQYLPKFNEKTKKNITQISELNNDVKLGELIKFIEELPPENI